MDLKALTLATRRSPLARRQTELAAEHLREQFPGIDIETLEVTTTGDRRKSWSLEERGGKGLFTKELEEAVLEGRADIAVHSAKDLPTEEPPGLVICGYLPREAPHDVFAMREGVTEVREIATSSPRRRFQAKTLYPKACWGEIRGNVDTRLKKVVLGHADATILAAAGLNRLGLNDFEGIEFKAFTLDEMVPAAGQAAVALQCRPTLAETLSPRLCGRTGATVHLEREVLSRLGGGCHVATAVHHDGRKLHVFHESVGKLSETFPIEDEGVVQKRLEEFMERHFASLS